MKSVVIGCKVPIHLGSNRPINLPTFGSSDPMEHCLPSPTKRVEVVNQDELIWKHVYSVHADDFMQLCNCHVESSRPETCLYLQEVGKQNTIHMRATDIVRCNFTGVLIATINAKGVLNSFNPYRRGNAQLPSIYLIIPLHFSGAYRVGRLAIVLNLRDGNSICSCSNTTLSTASCGEVCRSSVLLLMMHIQ